jgi:hypothetical protein
MLLRGALWEAHKNRCKQGAAVFAFVNWGRIAEPRQLNVSRAAAVGQSPTFILLSGMMKKPESL